MSSTKSLWNLYKLHKYTSNLVYEIGLILEQIAVDPLSKYPELQVQELTFSVLNVLLEQVEHEDFVAEVQVPQE